MFLLIHKGFFAFSKNQIAYKVSGNFNEFERFALPVPKITELGFEWFLSPLGVFNSILNDTKQEKAGEYMKRAAQRHEHLHTCSFIDFNTVMVRVFQNPIKNAMENTTYIPETQYQYEDFLHKDCTMFFSDEPMSDEDINWMLYKNKPLSEILERLSFSHSLSVSSPMACFWMFEKDPEVLPDGDYPEFFYNLAKSVGSKSSKSKKSTTEEMTELRTKLANYLGYASYEFSANNK